MTTANQIATIKSILGITDNSEDERIATFLTVAKSEVLSWRYNDRAEEVEDFPVQYEMTTIYAVVAGYSQSGAENQTSHGENGITRAFKYSDMIEYIHAHVIPIVKVVG